MSRENGSEFTTEELKEQKALDTNRTSSFSDSDLEGVVGGTGDGPVGPE